MTGYVFIKTLFTGILEQSTVIEGRFHISHRYGAQEINSDALGELITEVPDKKYPLSLMPPPHSRGKYSDDRGKGEWERYRIILFFVNTTYSQDINPDTKTSEHPVIKDWDEMKQCALAFKRKLEAVQRSTPGSVFRVPDNQALCIPVSIVGNDRVSGIRLDFDLDMYIGCEADASEYPTFTNP